MTIWVYMLECSDRSYYVGSARGSLEKRLSEHEAGSYPGYTSARRPVRLVWSQDFESAQDAISVERQLKGWRRAKKEALIEGRYADLPQLAKRAAEAQCDASYQGEGELQ